VVIIAVSVAMLTAGSRAQNPHDHGAAHEKAQHESSKDAAASLSPELRKLLNREMTLIDEGMGTLASAISAGEWKKVADTAAKIERSFILKQEMTAEAMSELHEKLPAGFVEMDRRFHATAGKLVHAAHGRDGELATYYYGRMLEGCVSCHAAHASGRFPGLKTREPAHRH
jgi:hypothetical protein